MLPLTSYLTNHIYFNLSGNLSNNVLNDKLYINASKTYLNDNLVVEKKIDVDEATVFRKPKQIGQFFNDGLLQKKTKGYDYPYYLDDVGVDNLATKVIGKSIDLEVYTTYLCTVFYSNNPPLNCEGYNGIKKNIWLNPLNVSSIQMVFIKKKIIRDYLIIITHIMK